MKTESSALGEDAPFESHPETGIYEAEELSAQPPAFGEALCFRHDPETGEFLGEEPIPLDHAGNELIPPNATKEKPPEKTEHKTPCWDGEEWILRWDYRGTYFWPADAQHGDEPAEIIQLGDRPPNGCLFSAPERTFEELKREAIEKIMEEAEIYRARFVQTDPGKLSEYQIKERLAEKTKAGDAEARSILSLSLREKDGGDVDAFAGRILKKAKSLESVSMIIAANEENTLEAIKKTKNARELADVLAAAEKTAEQTYKQMKTT